MESVSNEKRQEYALYGVCVATLVGLCMWPIWGVRFLPMQDYPQHLFLSYVLSAFDDPSMNWAVHYTEHIERAPTPSTTWSCESSYSWST